MGGSLYNKIPLGRRYTVFNLRPMHFAVATAALLSLAAVYLIIR